MRPVRRRPAAEEIHDHDRGLAFDMATLMNRRRALTLLGGAGLAAATACASSTTTSSSSSTDGSSGTTGAGATGSSPGTAPSTTGAAHTGSAIPQETAGPFPGDGSNGINVLSQSGIVRTDIVSSFGSASGVAAGVPLTIKLRVLSVATSGAPLAGAAVYVWHCDRDGNYSLYSPGVTGENYLRGVQEADANGYVTFTSIFPGAYPGRWPHIHFEVYPDLATATRAGTKLRTSQLALPEDACKAVYATSGYGTSLTNLAQTSLSTDMVFSDGYSLQLATVAGTPEAGLVASLDVPV